VSEVAEVRLWGTRIGAVALERDDAFAIFQYDPDFLSSGIEVSPLMLPLTETTYRFPELSLETFRGLPGMLADSLPDKFGEALIAAWLSTQGRTIDSFSSIQRLCYVHTRGMGALEYLPAQDGLSNRVQDLQVDELVKLAGEVLAMRRGLDVSFATSERKQSLIRILQTSSSAGGARAKALIAWNPKTQEVKTGHAIAPEGFEHWLIKFDGVSGNRNDEARDALADPLSYTVAEYVYSLLAKAAGIEVSECRLLEENGRRHFMTKRFDRIGGRDKVHMQSLGGMAHMDFNRPAANTYEAAFQVLRRLKLGRHAAEQLYRRMLFNVIAHNHDDHVKNIAFLMDRQGQWRLAPAYDLAFNHNPLGWTREHQMSINGKRDDFTQKDFEAVARKASVALQTARRIYEEVREAVSQWDRLAHQHEVPSDMTRRIQAGLRLTIP
jgi:serine/threonine-protein kinase HipA